MGVQIVVATTGRLLEILSKINLDLSNVKCLVIDEVDSMFQLGFEQQVKSDHLISIHYPSHPIHEFTH